MSKSRFVARYDGKAWGVWDRPGDRWMAYPVSNSDEARAIARTKNAPAEEPRVITVQIAPEETTWTNISAPTDPGLGMMRPLEFRPEPPRFPATAQFIMDQIAFSPAPIMGPRQLLGRMLAADEEQRERELAKLPVQQYAIPMCSHCSEIDLRKRSRN